MRRKISILSFLIVFNCLLDSCSSSDVTCYELEILSIKNFTLDGYMESTANDTTAVNDYAILLEAESMTKTCLTNYSFGGTLLADEPIIRLVDKVTNISIKSNSSLSPSYPAESELKSLFVLISFKDDCLNSAECVATYSEYNSLTEAVNDVVSQNLFFQNENDKYLFSLSTAENITSNNHEITVKFDFESGASTEFKTEQIILN